VSGGLLGGFEVLCPSVFLCEWNHWKNFTRRIRLKSTVECTAKSSPQALDFLNLKTNTRIFLWNIWDFMCYFKSHSNFFNIFGIESKDSLDSRVHYYHDSIFTESLFDTFLPLFALLWPQFDEENNILSSAFARSCRLWENCYFICYRIRKFFFHSTSHLIFFSTPMETFGFFFTFHR
jgi:hypothetical protein